MNTSKDKIKLSISLLVSNSIDTIEKCMTSLVPLLEQIPGELIVVDTGGTDGSIEVARRYADKVIPFTWCNDFSKARNAGLMVAKGEWFLFLDDDEWFEDVGEIIEFFKSRECEKYNCATYVIRNYADNAGSRWKDMRAYRMARRTKELRFISPIHEMLEPVSYPEKVFDTFVHHYGYVFQNDEEAKNHALRNITLLRKVLENTPEDFRLLLQLAQEYRSINEVQLSKETCLDAIELSKKINQYTPFNVKMLGWILQNVLLMEIRMQNDMQAFAYGKEYIEYPWINFVTRMNLANELMKLSFKMKKKDDFVAYLEIYKSTYFYLKENLPQQRDETVLEQDECLKEERLLEGLVQAFQLVEESIDLGSSSSRGEYEEKTVFSLENGNMQKGDIIEQLRSFVEEVIALPAYNRSRKEVKDFLEYLLMETDENIRRKLKNYLLQKEQTRKQIVGLLEEESQWGEIEYQKLIFLFGETRNEYEEFLPYHILYQYYIKENVAGLLTEYFATQKNRLNTIPAILKIATELGMDLSFYINGIELGQWADYVDRFVVRASLEKKELMLSVLENIKEKDFKANYLHMFCLEGILKSGKVENFEYEELKELIRTYCGEVLSVNGNIYNANAFDNEFGLFVPKSCLFAKKIKTIFEEKADKVTEAKRIKEATEVYPEMANLCKTYLLKMQEAEKKAEQEKRDTAISEEFRKLAVMIKAKIRELINMGAIDAARQTLTQLEAMVPGDKEVAIFKEEIEKYV